MSKILLIFLLLTIITTNIPHHISATNHTSPSQPPNIPPPKSTTIPPSKSTTIQQQQLKNILDALIGSGDFTSWLNTLFNPTNSTSSISSIPTTTNIPTAATIFLPENDALSHLSTTATGSLNFDPLTIIPYHILPQRFTFSELQLFKTNTRIPTLLPFKTIVITNNEIGNFTIDDSLITSPDFYTNDVVCVHGVENLFDFVIYGDAGDKIPANFLTPPPVQWLPPADDGGTLTADDGGTMTADVASSICGADFESMLYFPIIILVFYGIQRKYG